MLFCVVLLVIVALWVMRLRAGLFVALYLLCYVYFGVVCFCVLGWFWVVACFVVAMGLV